VTADEVGTAAANQGTGAGRVTGGERFAVGGAHGHTAKALGFCRVIGEGLARHGIGHPQE
jgi:hypothetical protein